MNIKNILLMAVAAVAFVACDEVDEKDRLIYVTPADAKRAVLVEDFTGQKCLNCPNAASTIAQMDSAYGEDKIIAVSIHGGAMSLANDPSKSYQGLATTLGNTYNDHWGVESWPAGLINRRGGVMTHDKWMGAVLSELAKEPTLDMSGVFEISDDKKTGYVTVITDAFKDISGKIQLWVVEDSIVSWQTMPDRNLNKVYVHNHVLRAAINGDWGQDFSAVQNEEQYTTAQFDIDLLWNPDRLSVVAFVYNDGGVEQAVRIHN